MGLPPRLALSLAGYLLGNALRRNRRFPYVLMLEPTLRCNLACAGCGRVRESAGAGRDLTARECLEAVETAAAPVVSIAGGEPLLHPEIGDVVRRITAGRRFVHLCTNGLLLERSLDRFVPGPRFSFVVHLDGLEGTHDGLAGRAGVFAAALAAVRAARARGFRVLTNTTLYRGSRPEEVLELFRRLRALGVEGMMVSPAFGYEAVEAKLFPSRRETAALFAPLHERRSEVPFYNTPAYLEFLSGRRELSCRPWTTPTRTPRGWRSPCYLLADAHFGSWPELVERTPWERYGPGRDPRCSECMMHSGFEASAVLETFRSLPALRETLEWSVRRYPA